MSMYILASALLVCNGTAYVWAGISMLFLLPIEIYPDITMLYARIFRQFELLEKKNDDPECDEEKKEDDIRDRLDYRLIGYWLVFLGILRCMVAFCSSCLADRIGMFTFGVEILVLCNELLRMESVLLHKTMAIIFECVVMIIIYMATKLPECV